MQTLTALSWCLFITESIGLRFSKIVSVGSKFWWPFHGTVFLSPPLLSSLSLSLSLSISIFLFEFFSGYFFYFERVQGSLKHGILWLPWEGRIAKKRQHWLESVGNDLDCRKFAPRPSKSLFYLQRNKLLYSFEHYCSISLPVCHQDLETGKVFNSKRSF